MSFIVEKGFEYEGYKCVVTFGDLGHRCGYVGVDKTHPLYKVNYYDYLDILKEDIGDREVSGVIPLFYACLDTDERIKADAYFQVHGGLTYSGGGDNSEYPIKSDLWWLGFDCGHYDDRQDLELAIKVFPERKEYYEREMFFMYKYDTGGEIRTLEYVENECKQLVTQLEEYKKLAEV